jgi:hypothetical protein
MEIKDTHHQQEALATTDRSLALIHSQKSGKVSNKWSSYIPYYDDLLRPWRDLAVRLLEIGVQNGGSLETWGAYFANSEKIIGCDKDLRCANLQFENPKISLIIDDANSHFGFEKILANAPFDIIIDDGSHLSEDILVSFFNYFQILKPGGVYIIEDTHAVYQAPGTGIHNKSTAIAFFKDATDLVNYQFWHGQKTIEELVTPYLSVPSPSWISEGWIESIEFRNSIITIKKSLTSGHDKLGFMHITGTIAEVDGEPLKVKQAFAGHLVSR